MYVQDQTAPTVIISTLRKNFGKSDDPQVINGKPDNLLFVEKEHRNLPWKNTKAIVISAAQHIRSRMEIWYPDLIRSFFSCSVVLSHESIQAEPKPSAVFQETGLNLSATRCTAIAPSPNPETIRVSIMEMIQ